MGYFPSFPPLSHPKPNPEPKRPRLEIGFELGLGLVCVRARGRKLGRKLKERPERIDKPEPGRRLLGRRRWVPLLQLRREFGLLLLLSRLLVQLFQPAAVAAR
jgi:hypothetical protein